MAETNTSNIGFEKQIWDAACVLRGQHRRFGIQVGCSRVDFFEIHL